MKFRKFLLAATAIAVFVGGAYFTERVSKETVARRRLTADGGDPMPRPRPTCATAIVAGGSAASVLVADGGDPMPRPPHGLA